MPAILPTTGTAGQASSGTRAEVDNETDNNSYDCLVCHRVRCLCSAGDQQEGKSIPKDDTYHLTLSDGATLMIETRLCWRGDRGESTVSVGLWPKDEDGEKPPVWTADLTPVDYAPEKEPYYALVRVMEDRIFIFAMWNGRYCVIDRNTGRVLKKGEGDDVLIEYGSLVPLRLTILYIPPSTAGVAFPTTPHEDNLGQWEREQLEEDTVAMSVSQAIPGSKLRNYYVVQFDPHQGARAETRLWRPLFVIVWKAEGGLVSLDCRPAIAGIWINRHSVTPPAGKKAIYALQPDYSLQQLSLTEDEVTRLFSHITRSAERATTAIAIQRKSLPSDPYWEQKVGPHLKVVDPYKKVKGTKTRSSGDTLPNS